MTHKHKFYSVIASLSGIFIGFEIIFAMEANSPLSYLWQTIESSDNLFITSWTLGGTIFGAVLGNVPCDRIGRKNTLFLIGALHFVSAIGTALATDQLVFSINRFVTGLAIGISTVVAPTYISEISSSKNRGKLVGLFQINILLGIFIAYIFHFLLSKFLGSNGWRFILAVEAIPALFFLIMTLRIAESPLWLVSQNKKNAKALLILKEIFGRNKAHPDILFEGIKREQLYTSFQKETNAIYPNPYFLTLLIAFFNQASGIFFIMYLSPRIIGNVGFTIEELFLVKIFIGGIILIFTFWGLSLIDNMGRRYLMLIGSIGSLLSLSLMIGGLYFQISPVFNFIGVLIFIASHSIGQGSVFWVFISEIFPNSERARGQSFGVAIYCTLAAVATLFGSAFMNTFQPWQIVVLFLFLMIFQCLFVIFLMPETKERPLEYIPIDS